MNFGFSFGHSQAVRAIRESVNAAVVLKVIRLVLFSCVGSFFGVGLGLAGAVKLESDFFSVVAPSTFSLKPVAGLFSEKPIGVAEISFE